MIWLFISAFLVVIFQVVNFSFFWKILSKSCEFSKIKIWFFLLQNLDFFQNLDFSLSLKVVKINHYFLSYLEEYFASEYFSKVSSTWDSLESNSLLKCYCVKNFNFMIYSWPFTVCETYIILNNFFIYKYFLKNTSN